MGMGARRYLLPDAWAAAEAALVEISTRSPRIEIAGELRRQLETVSEVTLLAEVADGELPRDEVRPSASGIPVRILWRGRESFDGCWLYESASREHRESLARRAAARGYGFDPMGLRLEGRPVPTDEKGLYRALGLEPIHPLLRETAVEEATATCHLIGPESIRGVFHIHTTDTDGRSDLDEIACEAERLGYSWIGISDHSQSAPIANGLTPERLLAQRDAVEAARTRHPGLRILHGVESDIRPDGTLDYDDDLLGMLDFVIVSVHGEFEMGREAMTRRVERALSHPATTHWGHPTARLLPGKAPYEIDIERLLAVCARERVAVEFNAHPMRLDLDWRTIPVARAMGVAVSIDPDAHDASSLAYARLMVGTAAKGGLTPAEILNSLDADGIRAWLTTRRRP